MIGERLQELRKDNNISQAELAKILGVSHYTISSYECNRSDPDDNSKIKIAKLFDVSVDYLLGLINEPMTYNRESESLVIDKSFDFDDIDRIKDFMEFFKICKYVAWKETGAFVVKKAITCHVL